MVRGKGVARPVTWFRHLPHEQHGGGGVGAYPWFARWDTPGRVQVARALVEHFDDDRVAYWQVNEASVLDAMVRKEAAHADAFGGRLF